MNFKNWFSLFEMPIRNWKQIPEDPVAWQRDAKRQYGWDKKDAGILSSEAGVTKFKSLWANTEHNFDFYLVRTKKGMNIRRERGEVGEANSSWVKENLGLEIEPAYDAITVVFTNNTGAEKVPFTAWTAAHRLGHAFARSGNSFPEWQEFTKEVERDINSLLERIYGIKQPPKYGRSEEEYKTKVRQTKVISQDIGTMRSARQKNLRSPFEFVYELFAQYLLTKNKIQFNLPARQLILRYAWGNPLGPYSRLRGGWNGEEGKEIENFIGAMADNYNDQISVILDNAEGRIWVM